MSTPHMCVICFGKGKVIKGFYDNMQDTSTSASLLETELCRTCGGKGIVWDNVSNTPYYPLPNLPERDNNLPTKDYNRYNPCDNCPVRKSPNWNGICHCAIPSLYGNPIRY